MTTIPRSIALYEEASHLFPGGVNSPVRAFFGVGGTPLFIKRGEGAYIIDADENRYVDYVGSWGPLILGHAHPAVVAAVTETARNGLTFGAPSELESQLAKKIQTLMPNLEMMRFCSSGSEAGMSVIRLARAHTGRNKIIKFDGCYHGHADSLLVKGGSGMLTFGQPSSPGVINDLTQHTLVATYNDLDQIRECFAKHGDDIAAIIVEPVAGNMNLILPKPDFLPGLREICDQYESLLIFDEVMCGLRVARAGAQGHYGIHPDLSMLGKVIGGGLPMALYGGRKVIMEKLAPIGPVYQAGTLAGNPVAMAAGLATLHEISQPDFYHRLEQKTLQCVTGMTEIAKQMDIPFLTTHLGGMFGFYFTDRTEMNNLDDVKTCDLELFKRFYHLMLQEGIYFAPSMFEANFMSIAHGDNEINQTLHAFEKSISALKHA